MPSDLAPPLPHGVSLPHSPEAELALLGSLCLDPRRIDDLADRVTPGMFYHEAHRLICAALLRLHAAGIEIDAVTLAEELDRAGHLARVGGGRKLLELMEAVPHAAHAAHYAGIVCDKARQRAAVTVLSDGLERLTRPLDGVSIEETLAATEAALMQVLAAGTTHEPQPIGELLPDLLATMTTGGGPRPRIATGFPRLDELTGGLGPGKLIVVAARTSHGKTAFAGSLLLRLAQRGTPVFLASYEMTRAEIMARLIAIRSRVGLSTVEQGHGRREDLDAIVEAANELARWPILLDDRQPPETQLATTIRLQARKRGVKVAIVDYVGLVEPRDRRVLREQQIAGITRTLKRTALETGVCVIALAQLNRGIEHRDDKRPRLADLRESGAIEQDADQVWLLYRPHKDQPDRFDDHAELIVAKNRGGPCGQLALTWNGRLTEYTD